MTRRLDNPGFFPDLNRRAYFFPTGLVHAYSDLGIDFDILALKALGNFFLTSATG